MAGVFIISVDESVSSLCVFIIFCVSVTVHSGSLAAIRMQSTTNYLWLISDLLGQGATANVYRGRHKVRNTPDGAASMDLTQIDALLDYPTEP